MTTAQLRPPFAYYGGKQKLAAQIVALLPPHEHYVEPFAGSLAVLLAKPPSVMETVNDVDGAIMAFWRFLRDRPDDLIRVCSLTPHSRAEFAAARDLDVDDELEHARRVWVLLSQSRAGQLLKTGWRHYCRAGGSGSSMPDYLTAYVARMPEVAARLRTVSLECRPALNLIERYGHDTDTLLYCDPPYLASVRNSIGYRHEMSNEDHGALLLALRGVAASVVLSGYPSDLYDDTLANWDRVEMTAWTGQGAGTPGIARAAGMRTEVLWSNRPLARPRTLWDVS